MHHTEQQSYNITISAQGVTSRSVGLTYPQSSDDHKKSKMAHSGHGPSGHRHQGTTTRLAQLALGVLVFHVLNSILQEAVFHLPGFNHSLMLSFLQTGCIAAFALLDFSRTSETRKTPLKTYFFLSLFSTVSVILTNEASHLLNYPTQVIFKSSKLLFVMTLRHFLIPPTGKHSNRHHNKENHKRRTRNEALACLMIVGGLVAFTYATSSSKMSAGGTEKELGTVLAGIAAICIALVCDGLLYIGEEKYCFAAYKSSNTEVILYCYAFAMVNTGSSLLASGTLTSSIEFASEHPVFLLYVVLFSLCNFFGTNFLLKVVSEFNSNSAVIVTSVRKMFTVMCSFLIYPKPFGLYHCAGLSLVSLGIYMHESSRVQAKKDDMIHELVQEEDGIV
jgi:solute carrier family 35 (adenosine 3'-phospho 5'-phosphosulfate transporter), member B3